MSFTRLRDESHFEKGPNKSLLFRVCFPFSDCFPAEAPDVCQVLLVLSDGLNYLARVSQAPLKDPEHSRRQIMC